MVFASDRSALPARLPLEEILRQIRGGLIVSCQAETGAPLYGSHHMAAMARAAAAGGAAGIRANGPVDIAAIRATVLLPVFGIYKADLPGYDVRITPTIEHARQVALAGADVIAIDATRRPHPEDLNTIERIEAVRRATGCPVMADVSNLDEGLMAASAGADLVATTLSGYTQYSLQQEEPDFELLAELARRLSIPVIAEGRIATPQHAARALQLGAFAVVAGSAITRPQWITRRFVEGLQQADSNQHDP
jgi:N-acylglucosamine-6-phosphate 2-epimerase